MEDFLRFHPLKIGSGLFKVIIGLASAESSQ